MYAKFYNVWGSLLRWGSVARVGQARVVFTGLQLCQDRALLFSGQATCESACESALMNVYAIKNACESALAAVVLASLQDP